MMRRARVLHLLVSLLMVPLFVACAGRGSPGPSSEPAGRSDDPQQDSTSTIAAHNACISEFVLDAAKQRANRARRAVAEQFATSAHAAHREDVAARTEAAMIVRAQRMPDKSDPASIERWGRLQYWASASTVQYFRASERNNAEQLASWAARMTAEDWSDYAKYAQLRAAAFAYADSAAGANSSSEKQRHETLHDEAVVAATAFENHTPEMGRMYALEFLTELDRGRCLRD